MQQIDRYRDVAALAKELVNAEQRVSKLSETAGNMDMDDTVKRRATARTALNSACEARNRSQHALHVAIVRANLARAYEDSYYGEFRGGTPDYPMMIVRDRP